MPWRGAEMRRDLAVLAIGLVLAACGTEPTPPPPPLAGKIVFSSTRDNPASGIPVLYVMNSNGSEVQRLRIPLPPGQGAPDVDPAGARVAFMDGGIFTVRADGSQLHYVISDASAGYPHWSPNGKRLAYDLDRDLWVASADGSHPVDVTNTAAFEALGDWSPDGQRLVYTRADSAGRGRLVWTVNADGTDPRQVTTDSLEQAITPVWSPDGVWIAYIIATSTRREGEIRLVHPDGTGDHAIFSTPLGVLSPDWSPDGEVIAFEFESGINVIQIDGSGLRRLTSSSGYDGDPAWGPATGEP